MFSASNTIRLFFINVAIINTFAIWLTGFAVVHWFAYVIPVAFTLAAISGFCPGLILSRKILGMLGINP